MIFCKLIINYILYIGRGHNCSSTYIIYQKGRCIMQSINTILYNGYARNQKDLINLRNVINKTKTGIDLFVWKSDVKPEGYVPLTEGANAVIEDNSLWIKDECRTIEITYDKNYDRFDGVYATI